MSEKKGVLLATLIVAMDTFPTLRLGQLLENCVPEGRSLFYIEDAELVELLNQLMQEHGQPRKLKGSAGNQGDP